MMMLAAAITVGTLPQKSGSAYCPPDQVRVSKTTEPQRDASGQVPAPPRKSRAKEPSVLLPACRVQDDPKKADFPLA